MKLSIITVNYNNASGLEKTFKSVFSQSCNNFEYLVIDGGSTDGSVDIIKQNEDNISYWVSEKDKGIYHAMNKGIKKATGDYLIFLNSGDCFHTFDILDRCYTFIRQFPTVDIVYGNILVVNDSFTNKNWIKSYPIEVDLSFFQFDTLNHQASLIKSNLFQEFGFYPENYKLASDYWLYLLSLLQGKSFKFLDVVMVEYDRSGITGLNYQVYKSEKDQIWNNLLPKCVIKALEDLEVYKKRCNTYEIRYNSIANKRLIKLARRVKASYLALIKH